MFALLFNRSPDPMWLLEPANGRILDCNPAAVALMRAASPAVLVGRQWQELRPAELAGGDDVFWERLAAADSSVEQARPLVECRLVRCDGTPVRVEVALVLLPMDGQERLVLTTRDVTARYEAELALRENQRILASIADNLREAVYRSGPEHDLIYVNRAYLTLFGYGSIEELRSFPRERLYAHAEDRRRLLDRLARTGRFQAVEVEFVRKDGSPFWGLMSSRAIPDSETGEVLFHIGSIVDITDRRAAEQGLRQLNQFLEERVAERTAALQLANELLRDEVAERQRREKTEHALFRISESIHLAENLERLFPLIHAAVQELMPAENFYLALHDPQTDLHHFVYHVDERDPAPPPRHLRTGMTAHVFRTGRALLADRASMLRPAGSRAGQDWSVENGTPSAVWLGVPLIANGRTIGVMVVQDYDDEQAFSEVEQRILTFIGEQAAVAISRKRAEQALRDSEARHRALFEGTSQGVLLQDHHTIIAANPAAARMLGYPADQLLGHSPADFSAPIQSGGLTAAELADRYLQQTLRLGSARFDWVGRRADGSEFPMEVTLTAISLGERRIVQAVINDITERQRQLQVAQALYRISEAIHEADTLEQLYPLLHAVVALLMPARNFYIAIYDPESELLSFPYYVDERDPQPRPRRLGRGYTEYVMQTGEPLLTSPDLESHIRSRNQVEAVGSPAAQWLGVPLTVRGVTFGAMAVQDYRDGRAYGNEEKRLMMFVAEQTALAIERKRAADAFRQRHNELVALLNHLPGYAFFKDLTGRYVLTNENFAATLGHSPETIAGKTDAELLARLAAERQREEDHRLMVSGETLHVGEEPMSEGGRTFWVETTKVPLKNEAGQVVGILGLGFDVTERKRAELELRRALEREQELGRMKSNFTSLVSHEFRTPLGVIGSSAEILRDYFERLAPEERVEHLNTICKYTRRMGNLMEEVLLLSRFDAGKTEFQAQEINVPEFCSRIVNEVASATGLSCPVGIQVSPELAVGSADDRLLRHILTNLLMNAVKYSEPGTQVELRVLREGADGVFEVQDRGIGIPEADREWVFQAFHRGSNVGHRPGTGLGLVIVKRCVDLHGGRIGLESEVGQGTTMRVFIPMFGSAPEST